MYNINEAGLRIINKKRADAFKIILVGIPMYFMLFAIFLFLTDGNRTIFYLVCLPFLTCYISFNIYAVVLSLKRCNRTICQLSFRKDTLEIDTFSAYFYKSIDFEIILTNKIKLTNYKFPWYDKAQAFREGLKISYNGLDFFFVKDFFDNYDEIVGEIRNRINH